MAKAKWKKPTMTGEGIYVHKKVKCMTVSTLKRALKKFPPSAEVKWGALYDNLPLKEIYYDEECNVVVFG
jgi:predicted RNA-binding protein YlxR (DUF448 family)